jgi:hypothetical protein
VPEKGRQVRCGECTTVWWQEALDILTLDPHKEGVTEKERPSPHLTASLARLEKSQEEEEKPRGFKAFIHHYYIDWIVIILALGIILFIAYRERATLFDHAPSLKRVLNPQIAGKPGAPALGLSVQGINFDTTHHNNMPHLIISGEIVNVSAKAIPVPPLTITVSGKNSGQAMPSKSHKWSHANKDEKLLPGGRLPFQSITPHPGWSAIDKIDVSY